MRDTDPILLRIRLRLNGGPHEIREVVICARTPARFITRQLDLISVAGAALCLLDVATAMPVSARLARGADPWVIYYRPAF